MWLWVILLQVEAWPEVTRRFFHLQNVAAMVKALDSSGGLGPAIGNPGDHLRCFTASAPHLHPVSLSLCERANAEACACQGCSCCCLAGLHAARSDKISSPELFLGLQQRQGCIAFSVLKLPPLIWNPTFSITGGESGGRRQQHVASAGAHGQRDSAADTAGRLPQRPHVPRRGSSARCGAFCAGRPSGHAGALGRLTFKVGQAAVKQVLCHHTGGMTKEVDGTDCSRQFKIAGTFQLHQLCRHLPRCQGPSALAEPVDILARSVGEPALRDVLNGGK